MIRRLTVIAAASIAVAGLAACDEPQPEQMDVEAVSAEDAAAEAALNAPAPEPAAPSATDTPPAVDPGTLPADKRPSEETVKPESETLFY